MLCKAKAFAKYAIAGVFVASTVAVQVGLYAAGMAVVAAKDRLSKESVESREDLLKNLREEIKED